MSGTTSSSSIAYQRPARPMPDWISSAMNTMPCAAAEVGDAPHEARRRHDEAALALDRLHDHRGDVLLADVLVHLVDRVGERFLGDAIGVAEPAVRIGERQPVDLGGERPHALLVRHHLGGERHREQRASVERVVERDDRAAAGVIPGDLHGVLDGLGARVREHRLLRVLAGGERVQPLGELDVGLVRRDVEARVRVELGLTGDRRDDLGGRVADVQHGDAGGEVDQAVAVDVLDDRARCASGDDGVDRADARAARPRRAGRTTPSTSGRGSR